jgi:hypothetical protein
MAVSIRFDFSGAERFINLLEGRVSVPDVLEHPAYRVVGEHARRFSTGILAQDIVDAMNGRQSPFYGLENLGTRMPRIESLIATIQVSAEPWSAMMSRELARVSTDDPADIVVYPVIGYDMGVGLAGAVCMNLNCEQYLDEPNEFLFYAIHECVHAVYERGHRVPALREIVTPAEWRSYFNLWFQNEGFAVYGPLRLRTQLAFLRERDYMVLSDAARLEELRPALLQILAELQQSRPLARDEYIERCFGPRRLTYRMGCELVRRIEVTHGQDAVRDAFKQDADEFVARYLPLLSKPTDS